MALAELLPDVDVPRDALGGQGDMLGLSDRNAIRDLFGLVIAGDAAGAGAAAGSAGAVIGRSMLVQPASSAVDASNIGKRRRKESALRGISDSPGETVSVETMLDRALARHCGVAQV